jgi:hypothetical protein
MSADHEGTQPGDRASRTRALTLAAGIAGVAAGLLLKTIVSSRHPEVPAEPPPAATVNAPAREPRPQSPSFASVPQLSGDQGLGGSRTLVTNTASPQYDPSRLYPIIGPANLYEQEPRYEAWAKPVETWLGDKVKNDLAVLVPEVTAVHLDCRTSTCRLTWEPGDEAVKAKVLTVYEQLYVGNAYVKEKSGVVTVYYGKRFKDVPVGDADSLIAALAARRREFLGIIKDPVKGNNPLFSRFVALAPTASWPSE